MNDDEFKHERKRVFYLALKEEDGKQVYDENRLIKFFDAYGYDGPLDQTDEEGKIRETNIDQRLAKDYDGMVGFWRCTECNTLHDEIDGDYWCPSCSAEDQTLVVDLFVDCTLPFESDVDSDQRWKERLFMEKWIKMHGRPFGRQPDFLSALVGRDVTLGEREVALAQNYWFGTTGGQIFLREALDEIDAENERRLKVRRKEFKKREKLRELEAEIQKVEAE